MGTMEESVGFNPADEAAGSSSTPGSVIVPPYDSSKITLFCIG